MAQSGIENLDNQIPPNGTEPIYVKYADEEGKKRQPQRNNNNNNHDNHHHNYNNNAFHAHHQQAALGMNGLQNLGKMESNRGGQQNRYNPTSANYGYAFSNFPQNGTANFDGLTNGSFHNNFKNPATQQSNGHHQQNHQNNTNNNNSNRHNQQQQHNTDSMNLLNFDQIGEKGGHIIYVYGIGHHASEFDLYAIF